MSERIQCKKPSAGAHWFLRCRNFSRYSCYCCWPYV